MTEETGREKLQQGAGVNGEATGKEVSESAAADGAAGVPRDAGDTQEVIEKLKERQSKQEFYWKRQAERLAREMEAQRQANETELGVLRAAHEEAQARAAAAEAKANRLAKIAEAGLPSELAQLVPEADEEQVKEYVEKLKPLAKRLRQGGMGGTLTNPAREAGGEAAQLGRLAAAAKGGDRRALREYAHLREKAGAQGR